MMWFTHSQNKATLPRNSAVYRNEVLIGASGYCEPKRYTFEYRQTPGNLVSAASQI